MASEVIKVLAIIVGIAGWTAIAGGASYLLIRRSPFR